jgi:membrane-bound ClpP family serine protease
MDKRDFAFGRMNYILLAVGVVVVVIGFLLMAGGGSTNEAYDPEIFSARRIKVAPIVCLLGFMSMIYAVVHKPKDNETVQIAKTEETTAQ